MSPIICKINHRFSGIKIFLIFCILFGLAADVTFAADKKITETRRPLNKLFDHKKHAASFQQTKITCTDCHSFSVKSPTFDPLAQNVGAGFIASDKKVCHECHLGKVELPRVNQCSLCHLNPEKLAPPNHKLAWKKRHGQFSQMDPSSCNDCHKDNQNSCNNCHTQKNTLKPMVHRPNFRLTHSIEARANPARCVNCHTNTNSCLQCHEKGIAR